MIDEIWNQIEGQLMNQVHMYKHLNGHPPGVILAEIELYRHLRDQRSGTMVTGGGELLWKGIPVVRVDRKGAGVYLSDGPVPIRVDISRIERPCHKCENEHWDMPQCRYCSVENGYQYYSRKREAAKDDRAEDQ